MIENVLFDLDGTVTDSGEGITKSVAYALNALGITENDENALKEFIGPPLYDTFKEKYNLTHEQAEFAVLKYRERYKVTGIFENRVYDGIEEILKMLKEKGIKICLATSKPLVFALKILEHFDLKKYFDIISGSEFDGTRLHKTDVIKHVFSQLKNPENSIMVGDRKFDIISAHECNIRCIGVEYGFPKENELKDSKADFIANDTNELKKILSNLT